jgi:glycosyltransferase involved in cell wall biosynthesis
MRVLLVEPFLSGSHQAWAEGYQRHSNHDVVIIGHEGHSWRWRLRGSWATLAERARGLGDVDAVITSSMLDTAKFLGATRFRLGRTPVVHYMHENQLSYPLTEGRTPDVEHTLTNWGATVVADQVWFNSQWHLNTWYDEISRFLGRYKGDTHTELVSAVHARSHVVPVGVELDPFDAIPRSQHASPLIVWNQRWEYDKGLDQLSDALRLLMERGTDFRVALLGEVPATPPQTMIDLVEALGDRVAYAGFADRDTYRKLLRSGDIVVSTADHEFFGIAITEAIYAGAAPLLPNRVVYPERIPPDLRMRVLYDDTRHLVDRIVDLLDNPAERSHITEALHCEMKRFDWSHVAPEYDRRIVSLTGGTAATP